MPTNEQELINSLLESTAPLKNDSGSSSAPTNSGEIAASGGSKTNLDICQWQVGPNSTFFPAAKTIPKLPAGSYRTLHDPDRGPYLMNMPLLTDHIVVLPDTVNQRLLHSIQKFWNSKDRYLKRGMVYKRGAILVGPPGGGKTISLNLLMQDVIARDGVVFYCSEPKLTSVLLTALRTIEPNRPLIVVFEDIDEIIKTYGEHHILALLDGENQIDNCFFAATTNYPGLLGARIVNRPSRFDERIYVGMPSDASRRIYLENIAPELNTVTELNKWVIDTKGFSIAHLREMVSAVLCLEQPYEEVLERLKSMMKRPEDTEDGFRKGNMGYAAVGNQ